MTTYTQKEKELIKKTKLETMGVVLEMIDNVKNLEGLEDLKFAIAIAIASFHDAKSPDEATKNLKERFGIELSKD